MKKEFREFEAYCRGCRTIYYFDQKLPPGMYSFHPQVYGNLVILRFAFDECPFCTFDEDFANSMKGKN